MPGPGRQMARTGNLRPTEQLLSAVGSVAVLSMHTSPLAQPGIGDSGGMNVYVRELSASLAQAGVDVRVYVRRDAPGLADRVSVEPGFEVVHVDAGPTDLAKEDLSAVVPAFADAVEADLVDRPVDVLHANYWLSGQAGHALKHRLGRPARRHLPHARPGEGRGWRRRAGGEGAGRGRDHRLQRRDLRLEPGRGRAADPSLRRAAPTGSNWSRPASTTPSSRPASAAGPGSRSASTIDRRSSSPAGSSRSRACRWRSRRWPHLRTHGRPAPGVSAARAARRDGLTWIGSPSASSTSA